MRCKKESCNLVMPKAALQKLMQEAGKFEIERPSSF